MTSEADRLAAAFLRERLEAQLAWHRAGEPLRQLRAPIGQLSAIRDSVDLLPRDGDESWRNIAARLAAIPAMFASWRASLDAGLDRGLTAARRQAVEAAAAADRYAGTHDALVASYGDGPLAGELAAAAEQAHGGYRELARYLREDYAPRAAERDAVGGRAVRGGGQDQPGRRHRPGRGLRVGLGRTRPDRGRDGDRGGQDQPGREPRTRPPRCWTRPST